MKKALSVIALLMFSAATFADQPKDGCPFHSGDCNHKHSIASTDNSADEVCDAEAHKRLMDNLAEIGKSKDEEAKQMKIDLIDEYARENGACGEHVKAMLEGS